ncbi:ribonuclease HII [Polytolypa hystricis UAMH7299]|uniref:Ribonuclease n=1 Tax=Polytolypa hystricis (strain UAMH7299) TaxID=1447883 RepID=A0A2B7WM55_POLH7|nr:ribonuclease HII [Polytolypa hystricis UAMH7299]
MGSADVGQVQVPSAPFIPPSIHHSSLLAGSSYTHYTPCPAAISPAAGPHQQATTTDPTPCVLGVDEAGRGPVLGPMVYSAFYLPVSLHCSLLADQYHFDDSKVLTPEVRSSLMHQLCTPDHPLYKSSGWAVKVLSPRDISAAMLRPATRVYNLNAQAMDATVEIIRGIVEDRAIHVTEVYIDTIGNPQTYQNKLERIFPALKITVAKKADSLYPCVSAASVCAKVTRDVALDICYEAIVREKTEGGSEGDIASWGSGYPSDSKCVGWLKNDMDKLFGWGNECRFSWGTAKELLEAGKGDHINVDWPVDEDDEARQLTEYFSVATAGEAASQGDLLRDWYGSRTKVVF